MAADFYREVAAVRRRRRPGRLVLDVLADAGRAELRGPRGAAAIAADPALAGRLALWARRLVGEAISQAQHVLADRDALTDADRGGTGDLAGVAALITRITDRTRERMQTLGLAD